MNDASHKSRAFRVLLGWSRDDLLVALKVSKHSNADVFVVYGICLALEDRGPLVDLFRTLNGTGILEKVLYEQVSEELLEDGDFNTILLHPAAVADVYAMSEVIRRLKGTSLPMQETLLSAAVDAIKHNAVKRCLPYAVALAAKGKGESAKEFINALARLRLSAEEEKYIMHYIRRTGDGELASFASECFRES
jgi:hypothetical protein